MEAVARTPFFAERIAANPANRDRLLAMDPHVFAAVMQRWNAFFYHDSRSPMVGASEDELRTIAVPTLLFGGNDQVHPKAASDTLAGLISDVEVEPSPWASEDFLDYYTGRAHGGVMQTLYPALAPRILDFVLRLEERGGA